MIRFVVFLFSIFHLNGSIFLENCDNPKKSCIFYPKVCDPKLEISFTSNGTHLETEILYRQMDEASYVAIGLSKDDRMGNDFVLFCMRNSYMQTNAEKVGLGLNSYNRSNFIYGTVAFVENKLPFSLELLAYAQVDRTVYCRIRHRVRPVIKIMNGTIGHVLVARGQWVYNHGLSYHGKYRMSLGPIDFSRKRRSHNCKCSLSSAKSQNAFGRIFYTITISFLTLLTVFNL